MACGTHDADEKGQKKKNKKHASVKQIKEQDVFMKNKRRFRR